MYTQCYNFNTSLFVGATAVDALSIGYRTILLDDCCRGVDLEDIEKTKKNVISNHGVIVNSNLVIAHSIPRLTQDSI